MTLYDPPSGWLHGFPKPYKPRPGESLQDTLLRDGYPKEDAEWASKHCRFFGYDEGSKQFCPYCGAGLGKFRRDGEGTCPKCAPL
jgi:hypothetical protein